ncbi:MAG: FAD-binding oxidoreductase, partial [Candidatus Helarchaeota archaeon]
MIESDLLKEFQAICGEQNVSTDLLEGIAYTSDLAALPPILTQIYKIQFPQFIIRPTTSEQISQIIKIANTHNIPFTPRAGASSGSGAVIPIDGGILLDLTQMQKIIEFNSDAQTITVQPGITWRKLMFELSKFHLIPGIHPSSSPAATVGGFISTGGYAGIGAPKFGHIGKQVQHLKVVLPSGIIKEVYPPFCSLFIGAEGTLGIITEVTLRTYPKWDAIVPLAFGFNSMQSAISSLQKLLKAKIHPYYVTIFDRYFLDVSKTLGREVPKNEILMFMTLIGSQTVVQYETQVVQALFSDSTEL